MCIEVLHSGDERIILDAGTGVANLGDRILSEDSEGGTVHLLISHYHWDHIMGLPFFGPIYRPGFTVNLYGLNGEAGQVESMLDVVFSPYYSPIYSPDNLLGNLTVPEHRTTWTVDDIELGTYELEAIHPGGYMLIRVSGAGKRFLYASDVELRDPEVVETFVETCHDVQILVVNAAFSQEAFTTRVGWGHSSFEASCEAGHRAGVEQVIGIHYDPLREDDELDAVLQKVRARYPEMQIDLACEGKEVWFA